MAYSISLSTFTTLAVSVTTQRERGQPKRLRGTPMPGWTFIAAQVLRATAQALAMTLLLVGPSFVSGVWIPIDQLPHWLEQVSVLLVWAAIGAWVATRRFRWEPLAGTG